MARRLGNVHVSGRGTTPGNERDAERQEDHHRAHMREALLAGMKTRGYSVKFTGENRA